MTTEEIFQRLVRYYSHVYNRQWQSWELLVISLTSAFFLVLILMTHRKKVVKVPCLPEHVPVIGARLIDRNRRKIMPRHWGAYLLIVLFISLSLVALWQYVLQPRLSMKAEPSTRLTAGSFGGTTVSIGNRPVAQPEENFNPKVDPFTEIYEQCYAKYRNRYALLEFSNEFVELSDFDPLQESKRYRRGNEDTGHPLPDWETGQYGSIPPRRIVQILGPDDMLVAGLFSEGGRLVRFRGWLTAGLRKGQVWPFNPNEADPNERTEPLEVAVAGEYTYRTLLGEKITVPSVVPLKIFRQGITPEQFRSLLLIRSELPDELRRLRLQLQDREAALSDEKPIRTNQASL